MSHETTAGEPAMTGAGAGDTMSRGGWNYLPTQLQMKPHEGLKPEAIRVRNVSQTLISEEASATPRLARPPEWMQRDLPCTGRWDLFDIDSRSDRKSAAATEAKALCAGCPAREVCLDDAMEAERSLSGQCRVTIRGGLLPTERATLARKRGQAA